MRIKLLRLADRGVPNKERVELSVDLPATLSYYVALKTSSAGQDLVSSGNVIAYWFPTIDVKPGDHVFLYTGPGPNTVDQDDTGRSIHHLHWGQPQTIFNSATDCAVVVEAAEWMTLW